MQESSTEEGTPYSANPLRPMTLSMKISKTPRGGDHFMAILFQWHSLTLKSLRRCKEAGSLQGQEMETGAAGTQMEPTRFTGTQHHKVLAPRRAQSLAIGSNYVI